jgi:hypothetical protein
MKIAQYGATIVGMHAMIHGLHGFSTTMVFKLREVCHENSRHWWQWANW